MWIAHENFQNIVRDAWNHHAVNGTAQYQFCKKLQGLKGALKQLNRKHFSHISARAERAHLLLKQVQQQLHDQPANVELPNSIPILRKEAMFLKEAEIELYQQRAKEMSIH